MLTTAIVLVGVVGVMGAVRVVGVVGLPLVSASVELTVSLASKCSVRRCGASSKRTLASVLMAHNAETNGVSSVASISVRRKSKLRACSVLRQRLKLGRSQGSERQHCKSSA